MWGEQINYFTTGNTILCIWKFERAKLITLYTLPKKTFLHFFCNSEANASELLESIKEIVFSLLIVVSRS